MAKTIVCDCTDCVSGKIQSVAGPGCSLPAHEFTEFDDPLGTNRPACWNCGAVKPEHVEAEAAK